jgi:uncharacterized protein YggE
VLPLSLLACELRLPSRVDQPDTLRTFCDGLRRGLAAPDLAELQVYERPDADAAGNDNGKPRASSNSGQAWLNKTSTPPISVCAEQDYDSTTGYRRYIHLHAHYTLDVSLRDLTKVGEVMSGALHAGAISVSGVHFMASDLSRLEDEARANAVADARARAEQVARAAGVTLDQPVTLSESTGGYYSGFEGDYGYGDLPSNVSTVAGRIQVAVQVSVVYSIK